MSELKDTKFVKAKCSKTGISFAIEIKKFGSTWKAVDFVRLTEEQARKMESQVTVSEIVSAESILDCDVCRNRKIGGCSCPSKGRVCKVSDPYRFQCIYCDKLQLDYSAATGIKEGEKIILAQGQVITLSKRNANISKLEVGVGWRPSLSGANMDPLPPCCQIVTACMKQSVTGTLTTMHIPYTITATVLPVLKKINIVTPMTKLFLSTSIKYPKTFLVLHL